MMFDWLEFLRDNGIAYRTSGPNASAGNIAVHCPFCGTEDTSEHMSINIEGRGWRCWRRPDAHKGKSPVRLVQALINCTWDQATAIAGVRSQTTDAVLARVQALLPLTPSEQQPVVLEFPKTFLSLDSRRLTCVPYVNYLKRRGYSTVEIDMLTERYGLRYCVRGPFHGRIIFPVVFEGNLVSWTGRTIHPDVELRYKALTADPERAQRESTPCAIGAISHYLLWYDELMHSDADMLFLTEGPFDALNLNRRAQQMIATCFFTSAPTTAQVTLLHALVPRFKHRILLLDQNTTPLAMRIAAALRMLNIRTMMLPRRWKDPALLNSRGFSDLVRAVEMR